MPRAKYSVAKSRMKAALIHKSVYSRLLSNVRLHPSNISPRLSHVEEEVLRSEGWQIRSKAFQKGRCQSRVSDARLLYSLPLGN